MKSVKLRQRKIGRGRSTLYLDIYENGKRVTESLGMYLVPEYSRGDKDRNEDTLHVAQMIRRQREGEVVDGKRYMSLRVPLSVYIDKLNPRKAGAIRAHIQQYDERELLLEDITPTWVKGFYNYLDKTAISLVAKEPHLLDVGTKRCHFRNFKTILNYAVKDGAWERSPAFGIGNFKEKESTRMYLTVDEVKAMASTPFRDETTKRAFLFSCLTGLRYSDIAKLDWNEVHAGRIIFTQQKTGGLEYLDINEQAVELMGERGQGRVFPRLRASSHVNGSIRRLAKKAGIDKHITFHSARHTFAVMMLELGVDIYTVSKLLGHRSIQTTQIYAKILDKAKIEAVKKIPKIF